MKHTKVRLMLRKGYPEEISRLICAEMNTDFTAERMISYIGGGKHISEHKMCGSVEEMQFLKCIHFEGMHIWKVQNLEEM